MKRWLIVATAVTAALALAVPAVSAGAVTARSLGTFTVGAEAGYPVGHGFTTTIPAGSSVDSVVVRLPGRTSFGWHHHTSLVVVSVTSGALALYSDECARQVVGAGEGFVEEPGKVHLARNEGNTIATLTVTYLGVPAGEDEDVPAPDGFDPCDGIQ